MLRKLLVLLMVCGLASTTWAVNATWAEEMVGAPNEAIWNLNGTAMDYSSIPGVWYDTPNTQPGGYTWPKGTFFSIDGAASPLANKTAYTLEYRIQYTNTTATSVNQIEYKTFGDPQAPEEDGWFDTGNYKWGNYWGGADGWNYSTNFIQESPGTQTWFMETGQRFATGIGDITIEAMTKTGDPSQVWVPFKDNNGNQVYATYLDENNNTVQILDDYDNPVPVNELVNGGAHWNFNTPTEPVLDNSVDGQTNLPTSSSWLGTSFHSIQDLWSGANAPYNTPFTAGDWFTIRVVADPTAGLLTMYVNGVMAYQWADQTNELGINPYADGYMAIGRGEMGSSGVMWDYVRIYDGVLDGTTPLDAVPEPMTMTLLGLGGLAMLRRKR